MSKKPEPLMTYMEAVRHAVQSIIDADPPAHEIRRMVMSLIPTEQHVTHYQPGTCDGQHAA